MLTARQRDILAYIEAYVAEQGIAPTLEEIAAHFSLRSVATVHKHIGNLVARGHLRRGTGSRSLELVRTVLPYAEAPLRGILRAGAPLGEPPHDERIPVPSAMARGSAPLFCVRVEGDGFREEGLAAGDLLICTEAVPPADGDLVLALLPAGQAVCARYALQPAGGALMSGASELWPASLSLRVLGVGVGVVRVLPRG